MLSGKAKVSEWSQTALNVRDLDQAKAFYEAALGYQVIAEMRGIGEPAQLIGVPGATADLVLMRSPISEHVLELLVWHLPPGSHEPIATGPGTAFVSYRVSDLDSALAEFRALGATRLGEIVTAFGMRLAFIRDPSGTVIELEQLLTDDG